MKEEVDPGRVTCRNPEGTKVKEPKRFVRTVMNHRCSKGPVTRELSKYIKTITTQREFALFPALPVAVIL